MDFLHRKRLSNCSKDIAAAPYIIPIAFICNNFMSVINCKSPLVSSD